MQEALAEAPVCGAPQGKHAGQHAAVCAPAMRCKHALAWLTASATRTWHPVWGATHADHLHSCHSPVEPDGTCPPAAAAAATAAAATQSLPRFPAPGSCSTSSIPAFEDSDCCALITAQLGSEREARTWLAGGSACEAALKKRMPTTYVPILNRSRVCVKMVDLEPEHLPPGAASHLGAAIASRWPGSVVTTCAVRAGCIIITLDLWQLAHAQAAGAHAVGGPHGTNGPVAAGIELATDGVGLPQGGVWLPQEAAAALQWLEDMDLTGQLAAGARMMVQVGERASVLTRTPSGGTWACEGVAPPEAVHLQVQPVALLLPSAATQEAVADEEPGVVPVTRLKFDMELKHMPAGWVLRGWCGTTETADHLTEMLLHDMPSTSNTPQRGSQEAASPPVTDALLTLRAGSVYIPIHVAPMEAQPGGSDAGVCRAVVDVVLGAAGSAVQDAVWAAVTSGPGAASLQLELWAGGMLCASHPVLLFGAAHGGAGVVEEFAKVAPLLSGLWSDWLCDLSDWLTYVKMVHEEQVAGGLLDRDEAATRRVMMHNVWRDVHGDMLEHAHLWGLQQVAAFLTAHAPQAPQAGTRALPTAVNAPAAGSGQQAAAVEAAVVAHPAPILPSTSTAMMHPAPAASDPIAGARNQQAAHTATAPATAMSLLHDVVWGFPRLQECAYAEWVARQVAPVVECWSWLICIMVAICCFREVASHSGQGLPVLLTWVLAYLAMGRAARCAPQHLEAMGALTMAGRCMSMGLAASGLVHMPASFRLVVDMGLEFVTEPFLYTPCEQARVPLLTAKVAATSLSYWWMYNTLGVSTPGLRCLLLGVLCAGVGVALDARHRLVSCGHGAGLAQWRLTGSSRKGKEE